MSNLRSLNKLLKKAKCFGDFNAGFSTAECKPPKGAQVGEGGDKDGGEGKISGSNTGGGVKSGSGEMDFVQRLFIEKIREYDRKKKENGGKMFDPIPELESERHQLHDVLIKSYFKTEKPPSDLTTFPTMNFKDAPLDPIDMENGAVKTISKK